MFPPKTDLAELLAQPAPLLALAPMQDVTDLAFWRLLTAYDGADAYFTEYFRVYPTSVLEKNILKSITENPTGRPVVAQMIGHDIPSLVRTAKQLQEYPIGAVDLNLGCPAPVVYRKCAGGGLLRQLGQVDAILGALRDAVTVRLSVKTRIGFDSAEAYPELLSMLSRHSLDLVTVHARTVREMYRSPVRFELIRQAAQTLPCPVLANGNVYSAAKAAEVLAFTGARGLMIGRGAIRNPWIFRQIRQHQRGEPVTLPTGFEVLDYVHKLYATTDSPAAREASQVQRMKKFMNYLGVGVEPTGQFLHQIRRAARRTDFFAICEQFLAHDRRLPLEPFDLNLPPCDVVGGEHR